MFISKVGATLKAYLNCEDPACQAWTEFVIVAGLCKNARLTNGALPFPLSHHCPLYCPLPAS